MLTFAPKIFKAAPTRTVVQQKSIGANTASKAVSIPSKQTIIQQKKENTVAVVQPSRQAIVKPVAAVTPLIQQKKAIQPQLEIGKPNDKYEQEADRVADTVVRMPEPQPQSLSVSSNSQKVQRSLADNISRIGATYNGATNSGVSYQPFVQRQESGVANATRIDVESKLNNSSGRGSPMDDKTRTYFESRFGTDFSGVRVHTDSNAVQMNKALGSHAFAHSNNIYFNQNQYNPSSTEGKRLIAHELTHVVQQGAAVRRKSIGIPISRAPPSVQCLGMSDIRRMVNNVAMNIPGYQLLTTIIGYNFILGESVARTSANLILGFLRLLPPLGTALAIKLQSSEKFSEACAWIDAQVATLGLSLSSIMATLNQALNAISASDLLSPGAAIDRTVNYFRPYFTRVVNFASSVFNRVVQFLRETVLAPLGNFARTLPGYPLLCVIMGRDPIMGTAVPRTAENVVHGFMSLIPGGEEKFQQLQQSRAIPKAFEWFNQQIQVRNLTWNRVAGAFRQAWDSLSASDVLQPLQTIQRIVGIFSSLVADIVSFEISALEKILEIIFEAVMGGGGAAVLAILRRARSTFLTIVRNPVGFLTNLINAVKQGIRGFATNILTHLRNGVIEWLVGGLTRAGVQLPARWDMRGILSFVLQILGITYPRIREKMVRVIGERPVTILETGFELVRTFVTQGPMAAWQQILEHVGNLRDMVLNGIRSWIQQRIVIAAITRLATMFNPVGAVIQAIMATYNTVMFFIERMNQIMALVNSVVNSIAMIAAGNISAAANFVEQSMARTIPVILSFLSRLIGIGDIADPIRRVIQAIQTRVDAAIDRAIQWIRNAARRLIEMGGNAVEGVLQWWRERKQFRTENGETHTLYFQGEGSSARLMLASDPMQIGAWLATKNRSRMSQAKVAALDRIQQLLTESEDAKSSTSRNRSRTMGRIMDDMKAQIQIVIGGDVLAAAKAYPDFNGKYFKPSKLVEFVSNAEGIAESTVATRIRAWKDSRELKDLKSNDSDGYRQFSFHKPGGTRSVPEASKRQIFGFSDNVDKDSGDGFVVMMKGFHSWRVAGMTNVDKRDKQKVQSYGLFQNTNRSNRIFRWNDAIMGHDDNLHGGASGYWNFQGHKDTLSENKKWNKDPRNYWGPEHRSDSSSSGSAAARYNDPVAPRSHPMWWHGEHADYPGKRYSGYIFDFSAHYRLNGSPV